MHAYGPPGVVSFLAPFGDNLEEVGGLGVFTGRDTNSTSLSRWKVFYRSGRLGKENSKLHNSLGRGILEVFLVGIFSNKRWRIVMVIVRAKTLVKVVISILKDGVAR